ncbi:peptidase M23 [Serratia sp. D1N4]
MIISPPRLRNKNSGEKDADWVERMIPIDVQRNFPINASQAWHGGVHLMHSDIGSNVEYIRAIADGTVISLRQPDQKKRDIPPLNYNGSTDFGYVLLKHETEIGSGDEGKVQYYSLYMHMGSIKSEVKQGSTVSRKDPLGQVGHIDGKNGIHFQIFCDDANLKKLVGRETTELDTGKNGRANIVYGDMHFYLPAGTKFYPTIPANDGATATESTEPLYVTMRFEKGNCSMVTRRKLVLSNTYVTVGEALVNVDGEDYEYNLYKTAFKLYPDSPSAGYELLRFGRVINTEHETLVPANAPLWRTVNYPGGRGVVNLADSKITKFSDGDFPHWTGWILIDDDTDDNSQWNSPTLFALNGEDLSRTICHFPLEWDEATAEDRYRWLKSPTTSISLAKHQTDLLGKDRVGNKQEASYTQPELQEFDQPTPSTYELAGEIFDQPTPSAYELAGETIALADKDWDELMAHIKALCFDAKALGLPAGRVWHFEPRQFISHFRKCGWMGENDFIRLIRRNESRALQPSLTKDQVINWLTVEGTARSGDIIRPANVKASLSKVLNKYLITSPLRIAHFMGQMARETGRFKSFVEDGDLEYFNMYEPGEVQGDNLGNTQTGDGARFKGRGTVHLTGRFNYSRYSKYRFGPGSEYFTQEPNNILPVTDAYYACDAGGYFWVSKQKMVRINGRLTPSGKFSVNYWADKGSDHGDAEEVTRRINPGREGFEDVRWPSFQHAWFVLNDEISQNNNYRPIEIA